MVDPTFSWGPARRPSFLGNHFDRGCIVKNPEVILRPPARARSCPGELRQLFPMQIGNEYRQVFTNEIGQHYGVRED